jgi:hypothetical protein
LFVIRYYCAFKIRDDEVGMACNVYVKMRNAYKILIENLMSMDHMGDIGMSGRIILKLSLRKRVGGYELIHVAQNLVQVFLFVRVILFGLHRRQ